MKHRLSLVALILILSIAAGCLFRKDHDDDSDPASAENVITWSAVYAGVTDTLAVKSDGSLWAWGYNNQGQLGIGSWAPQTMPVQVGADYDWKSAGAGAAHSIGLKSNTKLYAWGYNNLGQLGDGQLQLKVSTPQLSTGDVASASAGWLHNIIVKTDGTLWTCGDNSTGQLGIGNQPDTFVSIFVPVSSTVSWEAADAGGYHSVALKTDGTLWAWGLNNQGQLGERSLVNEYLPTMVIGGDWTAKFSAGGYHTVAVKKDGTLWAWGDNTQGQLGDGTTVFRTVPVQIGSDKNWIEVSAGEQHTLALKSDGTLWAWGHNAEGELGDGRKELSSNQPVQVGTDKDWAYISAGNHFSAAIKQDGSLLMWGSNFKGQLGNGTTTATYIPQPVLE